MVQLPVPNSPYGLRERKATLNERQKYRLYHCRCEATLVKKKKKKTTKKKKKQKTTTTTKMKKNVIKRHRIDRPESVAAASLFLWCMHLAAAGARAAACWLHVTNRATCVMQAAGADPLRSRGPRALPDEPATLKDNFLSAGARKWWRSSRDYPPSVNVSELLCTKVRGGVGARS